VQGLASSGEGEKLTTTVAVALQVLQIAGGGGKLTTAMADLEFSKGGFFWKDTLTLHCSLE
jgi:hypothetical protein